jgi:O-antigen/teichoic acid export membrane protein
MVGLRERLPQIIIGRDHLFTYGAEFAALIGTVLVYRLAASWGESALDQYVIIRRTLSFLQPVLLVGSSVALTRFVASADSQEERTSLLRVAVRISMAGTVMMALLLMLFPNFLSGIIFGSTGYSGILPPVGLMLIGLNLHSTVYAYRRGRLQMGLAGIAQVVGIALLPNLAFLLCDGLVEVFWFTGLGWCLTAVVFGVIPFAKRSEKTTKPFRDRLLRYGAPRLPGDLALAAMLTIPVYVVAHALDASVAGKIGFGITLLNVVAAGFAPVAILLLPQAASNLAEGQFKELSSRVRMLSLVSVLGAGGVMLLFEWFAPTLLEFYLGPTGASQVPMARVLFLAAPAFAYFLAIRSIVDAYYHTPQNGINQLKAFFTLIILLLLVWMFDGADLLYGGTIVVSLTFLAYLSWRSILSVQEGLQLLHETKAGEGLRVLVVIPDKEQANGFPFSRRQARFFEKQLHADIEIFYLENRNSVLSLLRSSRKFKKVQQRFNPEVVHVHYGSVASMFTVLNSKAPVVITFLGSDLNPTRSEGWLRDLLGRLFSQLSAYFASGLICVSKNLRDRLWWRREEVLIAPLGAELEVFYPMDRQSCRQKLGWTDKGAVVLFNGNNPIVKRTDLAEKTIELLQDRGVDVRLHILSGKIPFEDIPLLLNASDALLLCSDSEGSPSMVKEAMACNIPVVSNDVGDVADRIANVHPGGIYEQNAASLADGLEICIRSGERSNGRDMAAENRADATIVDREVLDHLVSMTFRK